MCDNAKNTSGETTEFRRFDAIVACAEDTRAAMILNDAAARYLHAHRDLYDALNLVSNSVQHEDGEWLSTKWLKDTLNSEALYTQ